MLETAKFTPYTAFGLSILSEFELPELIRSSSRYDEANLLIKKDNLSFEIAENGTDYYYVKENLCKIHIPGVANFKIEDGKIISVSALEEANEDQIRLYILGTCMGIVLMQRQTLPIHGSAVVIDGKAYAIIGDSGAGKSTLASAFINKGYKLLTDDVIAVILNIGNIPIVVPSYPQQKLWIETLEKLGIDSRNYKSLFDRVTKYAIPVSDYFLDEPVPLAGIFALSKANQKNIEISPINQLERFPILYYNTYRNFLINRLGLLDWHFGFLAKMLNKVDFYRLIRPSSRFTTNELVEIMLSVISSKKDKVQG